MVDLTRLLVAARDGDDAALDRFVEAVYDELRSMARDQMRGERQNHTLEPTAVAHEALLRLFQDGKLPFDNRGHFFSAAAQALRRVLVDHARKRSTNKRAHDRSTGEVELDAVAGPARDKQLIALDDALTELARVAPDKARLVELRFFAGLSVEEAAAALGVSESTAARDWRMARAWLEARVGDASHERG